ncbi:MAG: hypothetical protein IJL66_03125 [Lachnospiraceae bacterium]|nr:hypothetical protein [Lachnospiraceae bacterium]
MTDIHSHILPGIDDGSPDLEESLEMLAMAADSGVETIVATSHCNIPGVYDNYASPELNVLFRRLRSAAREEGIPIRIVRGMEVFATEDLTELLRKQKLWTLGGTRNLLIEFSFEEDPDFCADVLRDLKRTGTVPVIAHPERYYFLQDDPQLAFEWCTGGCILQVNKGSILGRFGSGPERCAHALLQHGLAACVASDAHSASARTTDMYEVRRALERDYGEEYAQLLLEENPERILSGRDLLGFQPEPFL